MFLSRGTNIGNGVVHAGLSPVAAPGGCGGSCPIGKGLELFKAVFAQQHTGFLLVLLTW